ncbi:MAG TPA: N-acetylmuramoyl-L-alanine amidase [Terriglobales bacterium]|nr:N-acetylmuramoyl-L-alanine amidase [Terriglobales bacterium]
MRSNSAAASTAPDESIGGEGESRLPHSFPPSLVLGWLIALAAVLALSGSSEERQLSVYSRAANYSVAVVERNRVDYTGLLELLEPLGTVSAKASGDHWTFHYNDLEADFVAGRMRARVGGGDLNLPADFLLENSRGLVPLAGLSTLLPRILGGSITLNLSGRRLFVGEVAIHFTASVEKTVPPKLVMNFTSPVNPMIATEPGRLQMVFTHDPVVAPGSQTLTFDSKSIPSATFEESNGIAQLLVATVVPALASFSNDGRTITITPAAAPPMPNPPAQPPAQPPVPAARPAPAPPVVAPTEAGVPGGQHIFAVIDPAHGGDESGAVLTDQLQEKDVTLAFARRLRQVFTTHGLSAWLVRDGDLTLSLDQRAAMTNASGAAIYIVLHATSEGKGVRLYTALLPSGGENQGWFLDWETAQSSFEELSQMAAASVAGELANQQVLVHTLIAPLRPLNNVVTAALAIEVGPNNEDVSQLSSPEYQQGLAEAVASGVADLREKLEAQRK